MADSLAKKREVKANNIVAAPNISGGSAACAALVAILAASGLIPYGDPDHHLSKKDEPSHNADFPPLILIPSVAVTATLLDSGEQQDEESSEPQRPTDIELGHVVDVDAKLNGARHYKLDDREETLFDTILISNDDKDDTRGVQLEVKQAQARADEQGLPYEGVRIVDQATVGDALNLMLETNRWLKDWYESHREAWETRWEGDTGTLAVMIANQRPSTDEQESPEETT